MGFICANIIVIFGLLPLLVMSMDMKRSSKRPTKGTVRKLKASAGYSDNGLRTMRKRVNYWEIMMDPLEVDIVLKSIKGRKSYLEWGSGGSTLNFAQFISGKFVSVEHHHEWCNSIPERLAKKNIHNVDFYCIETIGQNDIEGTYATFKPYIDKINTLNESIWDFVLIDGRARVSAAIRTLSYIRSKSAVIVHDFERVSRSGSNDYSPILKYYDVLERIGNSVKMNTGSRGIAHLRRKRKYDYLEGKHDEVQKILDQTTQSRYSWSPPQAKYVLHQRLHQSIELFPAQKPEVWVARGPTPAAAQMAVAGNLIGSAFQADDPFATPEPTSEPSSSHSRFGTGEIIGIVLGIIVPLVTAVILGVVIVKWRQGRSGSSPGNAEGIESELPAAHSAQQEATSSVHAGEEPSEYPFSRPSTDNLYR